MSIGSLLAEEGDRLLYTYDFGDCWEHEIVLERSGAVDIAGALPVCTAGKGRCPPEDCGGVWCYADLRATLAGRTHDEHAELVEWLGLESATDFDASRFALEEVNAMLADVFVA